MEPIKAWRPGDPPMGPQKWTDDAPKRRGKKSRVRHATREEREYIESQLRAANRDRGYRDRQKAKAKALEAKLAGRHGPIPTLIRPAAFVRAAPERILSPASEEAEARDVEGALDAQMQRALDSD